MANRRAMKLFAVTVLAGAAPAYADTATQVTRAQGRNGSVKPGVDWSGNIDIVALSPRRLVNGSPACGNTGGKQSYGAEPCVTADPLTTQQQALLAASLIYQAAVNTPVVINPRLLGNARPACGNTGGKATPPSDCTAKEIRAVEAYDREYARVSDERNGRVNVASTKLMAAVEAAVRADPSLRARLLVNGRPACGNTMGKSSPPSYCEIGETQ
jgi:hypothetical protein